MQRVMEGIWDNLSHPTQESPTERNRATMVWGFVPLKTVFSSLRIIVVSPVLGACSSPSRLYGWSGAVAEGGKEGKGSES